MTEINLDTVESLMKLMNKHKINKLNVGDMSFECNNPAPKTYNTNKPVKSTASAQLSDLDSELFFHEGLE